MRKYFVKLFKLNKCNNFVEALQTNARVRKLSGLSVFELKSDSTYGVVSKFSWSGLLYFFIWRTFYYYCAYRAFSEDQTILRSLYNTRLKQYGDVFERVLSIALLTFTLWNIPFQLNTSTEYLIKLLDIDESIKGLGVKIDHSKDACRIIICSLLQVFAGCVRILSVWIPLSLLQIAIPIEVLFQTSVTNVFALMTSMNYCNYVKFLQERYKIINNVLAELKAQKSWKKIAFVRNPTDTQKILRDQDEDKYVCDKIKACSKTYGLIYGGVEASQVMYGFVLVCTLLFCLLCLVLYLFYFMEATAAGLFHDSRRYTYFIITIFWQILYSFGVIFLNIYFSESAVEEAKRTSYIVHEIINSDMSRTITAEAMQFSTQLLHQIPVFTACGLCRIDYMLLLQGAYSVATFLVILLQFVMD